MTAAATDATAATAAGSVESVLAEARKALASDARDRAWDTVESALRGGLWSQRRLWAELLALMSGPEDYPRLQALWLASPGSCHGSVPLLRTMARAAAVAGAHDEARALLRKAILRQADRRRRVRSLLGRGKRWTLARLPRRQRGGGNALFAERAATALADLDRELREVDARAFLISGTLLGFVREGGFIGWDKDIDVGYFTEETAPADLEAAFQRSETFVVRRLDFNTDRLRVNHTNGIMVDVFPHYPDGDRVWHDGTATRWWNTPFSLTSVEFLGRSQLVPDPPERYLEENYGDWRTPRSAFDARLDTPNVEVTDPEYFHTLLFFSLLDAVGNGNRRKRIRYSALLAERGETTWLERVR